jgi:hypothetical protein
MAQLTRRSLALASFGVLTVAGMAMALFALTPKPPDSDRDNQTQGEPHAVFKRPFPKSPPPRADLNKLVEKALVRGAQYLIQQQRKDGSWRSDRYEPFQDGTALTPLAVYALECVYDSDPFSLVNELLRDTIIRASVHRGLDFLTKYHRPDGSLNLKEDELPYPVYTASLTILALAWNPAHPLFSDHWGRKAPELRKAWVQYLKERQLTARLGWHPEDAFYGGWGYCRLIPRAPKSGEFAPPLLESNLSATVFALEALQAAGELDDETRLAARHFVLRCQNWSQPPGPGDDGGFFFIPNGDPVRNKAGRLVDFLRAADRPAKDDVPAEKMLSYGSATADGLLAMLTYTRPTRDIRDKARISVAEQLEKKDRERIQAAIRWLQKNGSVSYNPPGPGLNDAVNRCRTRLDGAYFYYLARLARLYPDNLALQLADGNPVPDPNGGPAPWKFSEALAWQLCQLQRPDGSWANPHDFMREDEPIVATSFALLALCRFDRRSAGDIFRKIGDKIAPPSP